MSRELERPIEEAIQGLIEAVAEWQQEPALSPHHPKAEAVAAWRNTLRERIASLTLTPDEASHALTYGLPPLARHAQYLDGECKGIVAKLEKLSALRRIASSTSRETENKNE